jgi:hypothetical protein
MIPGTLATASHYLRSCSVLVNDSNFRFTSYSALIGEPSVGKSALALAVFEKAAYEIERVSAIGADRSAIVNAGTIEAVVEILKRQGFYYILQNYLYTSDFNFILFTRMYYFIL